MTHIQDVASHHARFKALLLHNKPSEFDTECIERLPLMYPKYKSIVEKLYGISEIINIFIEENNADGYLKSLETIQECYIKMFEQVVEDRILRMCCFGEEAGILLAQYYGWDYFKFIKTSVTHRLKLRGSDGRSDEVYLIPRYCEANKHIWAEGGKVCLDADESKIIDTWDRESICDFFDTKIMYPEGRKLDPSSTPGMMVFLRLEDFNVVDGVLRDWTLPLRSEGRL